MDFLLVFLGSGIGGMLRHAVGIVSLRWLGPGFPYGTLAINVVGSALMGLVVAIFAALAPIGPPAMRLFLTTGILGGFTTFSTFSLDSAALWQRGAHGAAILYVAASVILSLTALFLTMTLTRRLV